LGRPLCRAARWSIHVHVAQTKGQAAALQRAGRALARHRCRYSLGSAQKWPNSRFAFRDGLTAYFLFRSANHVYRTSNGGDTTINNEVAPKKVMCFLHCFSNSVQYVNRKSSLAFQPLSIFLLFLIPIYYSNVTHSEQWGYK